MMKVSSRNYEIVSDVTGDIALPTWREVDLSSLESRTKEFKKILVGAIGERCGSDLSWTKRVWEGEDDGG